MDIDTYRQLRRQAAGLTRSEADVDDLVQDVLLAALQAGRSDIAWLTGVMRNQAAMHVRSAIRRRRSEHAAASADTAADVQRTPSTPRHCSRGCHPLPAASPRSRCTGFPRTRSAGSWR